MLVVQDAFPALDLPQGGVVTIGNYDGVHRGQRAILDRVVVRAREIGGPAVVVTFEPHPLAVLRPEAAPARLTTPAQKVELLRAAGVDALLVVRFTEELSHTSAEEFARDFLAAHLGAREVLVGAGFVFGHGREGSLAVLEELGRRHGFAAQGVPEVALEGQRISSTRIRETLAAGRVDEAAEMLGRPYGLAGVVVRGDRMGKRLGWPTANLGQSEQLLPADGVYAGRIHIPGFPATFTGVTNIGTRPTVYEHYQRVIETHILDFSTDVYGQRVEFRFFRRLREERIFPSVMDLSAQIRRDVEATREYFASRPRLLETAEAVEPPHLQGDLIHG
jgi:riboflavin kinase/FMN adenylyltransferase